MTIHVVVERHDGPPYVQFVGVYSDRKYADRLLEQLLSEGAARPEPRAARGHDRLR